MLSGLDLTDIYSDSNASVNATQTIFIKAKNSKTIIGFSQIRLYKYR